MKVFKMPEKVSINIARQLVDEIQRRIDQSQGEFQSVEEYVDFVLTEVLKEEESEPVYSPEEEEEIKERLHLIYMNLASARTNFSELEFASFCVYTSAFQY
jgi:Arc/MetJ-type ribon-helix-helix transcriptional regulator